MTDAEVRALAPGTLLETPFSGKWRDVVFLGAFDLHEQLYLRVRRPGTDRRGRPLARLRRHPEDVRLHPSGLYDHLPANVYADFLSERGEERAARILRDAFPLDDGKESPK
jgi:hypothetical protein